MNILLAGATGFVGSYLIDKLSAEGHSLYILTRRVEEVSQKYPDHTIIEWKSVYDDFDLENVKIDSVVNLLGENIAGKRWSNERKKSLYNSRIDSISGLINNLKKNKISDYKIVQASAIGIYGDRGDDVLTEDSQLADDFLANLCIDWEKELAKYSDQFSHWMILRIGLVLGKDGGAMEKILPAFKFGAGGKLGNGKQYMSWIHVADLVDMIGYALENDFQSGAYNATAPYPVTNKEFTSVLSNLLRKPAFLDAPKFALKLVLGEMSQILLGGANVHPAKFKALKFIFKYPTIEKALKEVVSKNR